MKKTLGGATTELLHDGLNPVQELSGATVLANLLTGLGIDEYFQRTDSAGARNFLTDALGSTVALTDPSGLIQTEYTYEPFGDAIVSGNPSGNPFEFTGREFDASTGLYYYRARYYHPGLQRFISEDPIELEGGDINLYGYVANAPTWRRDPFGLQTAVPAPIPIPVPLPPVFIPGTPENQQFVETTMEVLRSLMGRRQRESGLEHLSDEEIRRLARDKTLSPEERKRYQREEKFRDLRNRGKDRGGSMRPRGFLLFDPGSFNPGFSNPGVSPPDLSGRKPSQP